MIRFSNNIVGSIVKYYEDGNSIFGKLLWFNKGSNIACIQLRSGNLTKVPYSDCILHRVFVAGKYYDVRGRLVTAEQLYS